MSAIRPPPGPHAQARPGESMPISPLARWHVPSLARLSLAQASARLARGETTSEALTAASLDVIAQAQPLVNAFIRLDADEAMQAARRADAERRAGRVRGPLHGIPLAHKDIFYRPGKITTAGSAFLEGQRAQEQSAVLACLDEAGAIDLGTLNLAEFCVGPTGQNAHTGHCRNPWDTTRITGGSSSGSGAAVAARMVFGSIGSDTGGSIRLPAGICGLTGLKPSYGRISLRGAVQRCWSLDVFGPIARSAEDAALLFDAIDHFDACDPWSRALHVTDVPPADDWRPVIAVPQGALDGLPSDLAAAHEAALRDLHAAGVRLQAVDMPDIGRLYDVTSVINNVEATWLHRQRLEAEPQRFNGSTRSRIDRGHGIPGLDYLDAVNGRAVERACFESESLGEADALYLPLLEIDVPRLDDVVFDDTRGADDIVPRITRWTRFVSYLGLPALAMPVGRSATGMPVAAQLVGRYFRDRALLQVASRYQRVTDWHRAEPGGLHA